MPNQQASRSSLKVPVARALAQTTSRKSQRGHLNEASWPSGCVCAQLWVERARRAGVGADGGVLDTTEAPVVWTSLELSRSTSVLRRSASTNSMVPYS